MMDCFRRFSTISFAIVSKQWSSNAWNVPCLIFLLGLIKLRFRKWHRIGHSLLSFGILKLFNLFPNRLDDIIKTLYKVDLKLIICGNINIDYLTDNDKKR